MNIKSIKASKFLLAVLIFSMLIHIFLKNIEIKILIWIFLACCASRQTALANQSVIDDDVLCVVMCLIMLQLHRGLISANCFLCVCNNMVFNAL